jgi:hypothetical protein
MCLAASSSRSQVHRSQRRAKLVSGLLRLSTHVRGSPCKSLAVVTQLVTRRLDDWLSCEGWPSDMRYGEPCMYQRLLLSPPPVCGLVIGREYQDELGVGGLRLMNRTRQGVDEAGVPPVRRSAFAVLVVAVVVLTAVAIAGCGPRHSSTGTTPTPTSSTTYAEGGDSVPPLSTPGSTSASTSGGLGGPASVTPSPPPPSTPGGLGGPVTVTASPPPPPPSTPGGLGGPVTVTASPPPPSSSP